MFAYECGWTYVARWDGWDVKLFMGKLFAPCARPSHCVACHLFCLFAFRILSFFFCVILWGLAFCGLLSDVGTGDVAWGQEQGWAQKAANLRRRGGSAEEWPLIRGAVAKKSGAQPTPPPEPNLQDPGAYSDFSAKELDFAICPHKRATRALGGLGT